MTDDPHPPESGAAGDPQASVKDGKGEPPATTNGTSAKGRAAVRSGLAHRRNPVLVKVGEFAAAVRRRALKDPLATFLLLASIGLAVAFATLLGQIKPGSSGVEVPISKVQTLARQHQIQSALLLDHDSRVEVVTKPTTPATQGSTAQTGRRGKTVTEGPSQSAAGVQHLWAAYPASGAQTQQLLKELDASGASVAVDQQAYKGTKTIVVQFLIPILLLVCTFSLFMRAGADGGAGGIAGFSQFTGKGRKRGKGTRDSVTFADVAGAGEAVAELREIRDYLADPGKYLAVGAAAPKGVLARRPAGHRQDAVGEGGCR